MHSIPLSRICTGVAATLLAMVCLQKRKRMAGPTQMSRGQIGTGTTASVCSLTMLLDAVPPVINKVMHQSPVPADYATCAHLLLARSPAQRSRDRDKERGRKRDRSRSRSRERHHSRKSKRQDDHRHRQSSSRHRSDREQGSQEGSPDRRRDRSPRPGHDQPSGTEASDGAGEPAAVAAAPPKREAVFEVSKNGGKEVGPRRRGPLRTGRYGVAQGFAASCSVSSAKWLILKLCLACAVVRGAAPGPGVSQPTGAIRQDTVMRCSP